MLLAKISMGTTRDHPTNQLDISIKLSANYPLVLTCACKRERKFTFYYSQYISINNNTNNFVYNILLSVLMVVYFSWEIPLLLRSSSSTAPTLFRTSDRPVSVSSSNQICLRIFDIKRCCLFNSQKIKLNIRTRLCVSPSLHSNFILFVGEPFRFSVFSISNCSSWYMSTSSSVSSTILNPSNLLRSIFSGVPSFRITLNPLYNFGDLRGITNITSDMNNSLHANDADWRKNTSHYILNDRDILFAVTKK